MGRGLGKGEGGRGGVTESRFTDCPSVKWNRSGGFEGLYGEGIDQFIDRIPRGEKDLKCA